jgi:hypothetical protein
VDIPLDHNFPVPILDCLHEFIVDVNLLPLRRIDERLADLDDRQLVIALHQLGYPGFVTSNYKMLQNPRELAAVIATGLTVFAIEDVGHDPLRATGALLLDLPSAIKAMESGSKGVFSFGPRSPRAKNPQEMFNRMAARRIVSPKELLKEVAVSQYELTTPVLN